MFSMVNPNDVLSIDTIQAPTSYSFVENLQPPEYNNENIHIPTYRCDNLQPITYNCENTHNPSYVCDNIQINTYTCENYIKPDPPPVLQSYEEPKLLLHQQLERLTQKRRDRLKARLENTPQITLDHRVGHRLDKKMTSRERQLELERQESQQLKLKEHLLGKINSLEQKCNKLREILENIVTTSPEYNAQMISFLESSELLLDRSDTSTSEGLSIGRMSKA